MLHSDLSNREGIDRIDQIAKVSRAINVDIEYNETTMAFRWDVQILDSI